MSAVGWGLGGGVAGVLRRWPGVGFVVGLAAVWAVDAQWADWGRRGLVVPVVVGALVVSRWWPRWVWWLAAVVAGGGCVAMVGWPVEKKVGWGVLTAVVGVVAVEVVRWGVSSGSLESVWQGGSGVGEGSGAPSGPSDHLPLKGEDSGVGVVLVAMLCGALLVALTGSVRVAGEGLRPLLPLLALWGTRLDARTLSAVALVLAFGWMQGVLWSDLSGWVVVPLAVLATVGVPGGRLRRVGAAVVVAVVGSAPVVVDWVRDPPF